MNLKKQEIFLNKKIDEPYYDDYNKAQRFNVEKYKFVYYSLENFCKKNANTRIVILSRWCKEIPGMKLEAALKSLALFRLNNYVHPFRDENYLIPKLGRREILIPIDKLALISKFFEVSKKESKNAMGSDIYFSLGNYENYVFKRNLKKDKEKADDDEYLNQIEISEKMYFNKEYISEHKYASDYMQSYVEENKRNITDGEQSAKDLLDALKVEYEFQKPCRVDGHFYIMDFYLPQHGVCIEIDGAYHYSNEQIAKDAIRTNALAKSGILVVRFTNEEAIGKVSISKFLRKVLNVSVFEL